MASDNQIPSQFILNDDTLNDDTKHIYTDLYTAILYINQFKKTQMNGGYIQIPYFMPSGTLRPNATYISNVETKKYKCKNLYVFNASHKILTDTTFDAELVVELIPTTSSTEKLYLCFLLQNTRYVNTERNDIDKLINISLKPPYHYSPINFHLGALVEPTQKKIMYKSGIDNVIIFTQPIAISEVDFTGYASIPESLFTIYPATNYSILKSSNKEGFFGKIIEGLSGDGTNTIDSEVARAFEKNLISCTPVDDNDTTIVKDKTATYLMNSSQNKNIAQTAIVSAFILTIVCIVVSTLGGPLFFYYTISKHITEGQTLTVTSVCIFTIVFVLGLALLLEGMQYDSNIMSGGVFVILLLCLSTFAIALQRARTPNIPTEFEVVNDYMMIFQNFLLKLSEKTVWTIIIVCMGILTAILLPIYFLVIKSKRAKKLLLGVGFTYGFVLSVWMAILSQHGDFKS